jgi:quinol monooxygenase YgiN
MVILRAIMNVLPEKQKEIMQTLLALLDRPEMGEGCLRYGISIDIEDGNIFYLISEWETRQHLEDYLRSNRFSVLLGTKSLLSEPLKIDILTVSISEGGGAVDLVRAKSNSFSLCSAERRLTS